VLADAGSIPAASTNIETATKVAVFIGAENKEPLDREG